MKRSILLVVGMVLMFGGFAHAAPFQLDDQQMDGLTAGETELLPPRMATEVAVTREAAGGAIVANGSVMELTKGGMIEADGSQQNARAINLVNSAKSLVANGVNVLDAHITEGQSQYNYEINQTNYVVQDATRVASLGYYERDKSSTYKTLNSTQNLTDNSTAAVVSNTMVDTELNIVGQKAFAGKGVSIVGRGDLNLGPSSVTYGVDVTTDLSQTLNAEGSATFSVPIIGEIVLDATFNMTNDILITGKLDLVVDLPTIDVAITGGGCGVMAGNCSAEGSDNSSYNITNNTTEDLTERLRGTFKLVDAEAEYIVVDESSLMVVDNNMVKLTGGFQNDVRAVNVVNSAGGMVTNGVNVARHQVNMAGMWEPVNLFQRNVIMHAN